MLSLQASFLFNLHDTTLASLSSGSDNLTSLSTALVSLVIGNSLILLLVNACGSAILNFLWLLLLRSLLLILIFCIVILPLLLGSSYLIAPALHSIRLFALLLRLVFALSSDASQLFVPLNEVL